MKTYTWHTDPGHGWLEVPAADLKASGVTPTRYSYLNGGSVFLEEDCDAPAFLRTIEKTGETVNFKERHTDRNSPIRNYTRCPDRSEDAHHESTRAMFDAYEPSAF